MEKARNAQAEAAAFACCPTSSAEMKTQSEPGPSDEANMKTAHVQMSRKRAQFIYSPLFLKEKKKPYIVVEGEEEEKTLQANEIVTLCRLARDHLKKLPSLLEVR